MALVSLSSVYPFPRQILWNCNQVEVKQWQEFSFLTRHLPPKIWTPVTRGNISFIQHIHRWLCLRLKPFKNIWRKQKTKRGHLITSQAGWLSASANAYTLQISVLAVCLAITLGIVALDSKSTHTQLFPTILPPELYPLLLGHSSCDLPYSTATHIAASQGHRSLQLEKKSTHPCNSTAASFSLQCPLCLAHCLSMFL